MALIRDVDSRNLGYFEAVVRFGSIRAAAEHLHVAPSAISRQISELEHRLGVKLLERLARGMRTTEAGQIVAEYARKQDEHYDGLLDDLREVQKRNDGRVALACGEGYLADLVDNGLAGFLKSYPDISIEVTTAGTESLINMVADGDADLGLVFSPIAHPDTQSINVAPSPLMAVLPSGHALCATDALALSEIGDHAVATLTAHHGVRNLLSRAEADGHVRLRVRYVSNSIEAVVRLVAAGRAMTFLPLFAVKEARDRGEVILRPLSDPILSHATTHLVTRRDRTLPKAVRLLADVLPQALEVLSG